MRVTLPSRGLTKWPFFLFLAALLSFGLAQKASATHLLGGEVRYNYLGPVGTTPGRPFSYEVTVSVYINCDRSGGPNNSNVPFGRAGIGFGVYSVDDGSQIFDINNAGGTNFPGNDPGPGGTDPDAFVQAGLYPLPRVSFDDITIPTPVGCTISAGCVRLVTYTDVIDLPAAGGYYFAYLDRTRNVSATNLVNGNREDQLLYTVVPDPTLINRSPIFTDTAVALICAGDTATLINNASDPDGDRLTYEFYAPYGGTAGNLPATLTPPPTPVTYAAGFSAQLPFGAGGFAFINATSGLTRYVVPNPGDYVVGVRVNEFRRINGVDRLISSVVREIQLAVRTCPNNPPPTLQFTTAGTSITIEEGQTATFTANASVAPGNPIRLTATSALLDGPGGINATFNGQQGTAPNAPVIANGTTTLAGVFNFVSTCGSAGVYNINMAARDQQGCPVKTTSIPYIVTVVKPAGPTAIGGPASACPNSTSTFTATGAPANTASYQWTVTGGTIQGTATGATITVRWNTVGNGSVTVKAVSARGCFSDVLSKTVEVFAGVTATLNGLNASYCLNPAAPGSTLVGSPAGGTFAITGAGGTTNLVGNVFTPRVAGTFQITYSVNDPNGCSAATTPFSVVVNALPTVALAAALPPVVCSNDAPITLAGTVNGTAVTTGFTIDGVAATVFNPAILTPGPHVVALVGTGVGNCTATATRTVTVNAAPTVALTGLQPTYCKNAPAVTLTATANNTPITGANAVFTIDRVAATQLNPANLTVGFHIVRVQGTGPNGCRNRDSLRVEIKALPVVAITGLNAAYCRDAAPVTLTGTVDAVAGGGSFTIDGTAATSFNPGVLSVGNHVVVFNATGLNGCANSITQTVRVNALPVVRIVAPTATSFCLNDAAVTLTGNAAGQFFIDANPTPVTSFLPSALGVGAHTIRFTRTEAATGCTNDTTLDITIRALPAVVITGLQAAYCDAAPVTLTGTIDGVAGGSFTVDGTAATVLNPANLTPGTHTVIFSGTGTNLCSNRDTAIVTINALPAVAITGLNPAYCVGSSAVTLAGTVNSSAANGTITFTVNGQPATSFDPAALAPGTYTVVATGTLTATGCRNTTTQTVVINALPTVAITGLNPAYCVSAAAVPLTSTLSGGVGTVSYTINGNAATSFNPAVLGAGTYTVVATGTVTATTCQNTASQTVTINALPAVAITGLNAAYCVGSAAVPLAATVNGGAGAVTFTVNGQAATEFNPTTLAPGTYTVVATGTDAATTCVNTTTQTVVINALPTVAITGLNPAYCVDAVAVTLAATVTNGGTATFTVDGAAATTFNPATLGVGTHTVVATGVDSNTCQNTTTRTVVVNALPAVAITGLNPAYCVSAAAVPLTGTVNGAAGGVTFTIDNQPATSFNPATLGVGPHTVVVTGTDGNTCQNTATQMVTINALPTVAIIGLNPVYCEGDAAVNLAGTVSNNGAVTFTVNGTASGVFDPSVLTPGTYTVVATGTDANSCVNTATQSVVINPRPTVAIAGLNPAYCVSAAAVPLAATITGGAGTSTFTINGAAATAFDPATLGTGTYTVVATSTLTATGCQNTATQTVTINALPSVAITGLNAAYCQGDASVNLTATVSGAGTATFTVNGNAATAFDPSALAPGTYAVVATGTDNNTCQSTATQTVTINARPTGLTPTGPPSVCPGLLGVPYSVAGVAGQQYQWTVVGGTVASGQGTANVSVDWGAANPNASISVVTTDQTTICESLPVTVPVTVNQILATQTPTGTAAFCVNGGPQTFQIPTPSPGSTYTWALTGTSAGTITTGQGSATITVEFTQPGSASLVVTETSSTPLANCFGTSSALNVTVLPAPDPTLVIQSSAPAPAVCAGNGVNFSLRGGANSSYVWTVNGAPQSGVTGETFSYQAATAGIYTIGAQETNATNCTGPVIVTTLTVNPTPGTLSLSSSNVICAEDAGSVTLTVAGGLPGSTYQWTASSNGAVLSGQGTNSVTVSLDSTQASASLSVIETTDLGCPGTSQLLTVQLDGTTQEASFATTDFADPTRVAVSVVGTTTGITTTGTVQRRVLNSTGAYTDVSTVTLPIAATALVNDPSASPNTEAYEYRLKVAPSCGQERISTLATTMLLTATGTEGSGNVKLTWNPYVGTAFASYEVLRKLDGATTYTVVTTITAQNTTTFDGVGLGRDGFNQAYRIRVVRSGAASAPAYSNEAKVQFANALQAYNIITPDGDGKNDTFVVDNATLYPNNELAVFNRWGREVYRRKNYDNLWNGGDLGAGTYYYLFTANGQSFKGWFEIVK
jgi:gliding motility-associated-like protein